MANKATTTVTRNLTAVARGCGPHCVTNCNQCSNQHHCECCHA